MSAATSRDPSCRFDHCILAVHDLAAASAALRALGFTLSPTGRHSARGTANACVMLPNGYIELLALDAPDSRETFLREFLAAGEGVSAIALAPDDTYRCHAVLSRWGAADGAPVAGSRAMETPDGPREVRFRVCRVRGQPFLPGRVFLCEHLDRGHVYAPDLLRHANGASAFRHIRVAGDPAQVLDATRAREIGLGRRAIAGGVALDAGDVAIAITASAAPSSVVRPAGQMRVSEIAVALPDPAGVAAAARRQGIRATAGDAGAVALRLHGVDLLLMPAPR